MIPCTIKNRLSGADSPKRGGYFLHAAYGPNGIMAIVAERDGSLRSVPLSDVTITRLP